MPAQFITSLEKRKFNFKKTLLTEYLNECQRANRRTEDAVKDIYYTNSLLLYKKFHNF